MDKNRDTSVWWGRRPGELPSVLRREVRYLPRSFGLWLLISFLVAQESMICSSPLAQEE
jgi:hypothetical protein